MIVDQLTNADRYNALHPKFKEAFDFLKAFNHFEPQRLFLQGTDLIAIIESGEGRGRSGSKLEAHRKYIDIQYTFDGVEEIGWRPYQECLSISQHYHQENDIEFYADIPSLWLPIPKGTFAIFFPNDAHAPLSGSKPVRKVIMKVAVSQEIQLPTHSTGLEKAYANQNI